MKKEGVVTHETLASHKPALAQSVSTILTRYAHPQMDPPFNELQIFGGKIADL